MKLLIKGFPYVSPTVFDIIPSFSHEVERRNSESGLSLTEEGWHAIKGRSIRIVFASAANAGVRRRVLLSITLPFHGKDGFYVSLTRPEM